MNTTCRLVTVAAMLLHSMFGCSLHHACACGSHVHGEHSQVAAAEPCDDDHDCHHEHDSHDENACHNDHADEDQFPSESFVTSRCDCCEKVPCEDGDSPCCSPVQCSFILACDVEFSIDVGLTLFIVDDTGPSLKTSPNAWSDAHGGRQGTGFFN